jgi:SAM-dependent methyltransferase
MPDAAVPHRPASVDELLVQEEQALASSPRNRWYAAYLGRTYRAAAERAVAGGGTTAAILKADLWNEQLGGERDLLGRLDPSAAALRVGVDLSFRVCARARSRTAGMLPVQADIRALPFRPGSFDAVLDLSVIDHVGAVAVAGVIEEYRRVLRREGALLVVFWQRSAMVRLRLWLKRVLGRVEKPGQSYFRRADVRAAVVRGFDIAHEFAAGGLLVVPLRVLSAALAVLPADRAVRMVGRLGEVEAGGACRPLLQHFSGLYGLVGRAR